MAKVKVPGIQEEVQRITLRLDPGFQEELQRIALQLDPEIQRVIQRSGLGRQLEAKLRADELRKSLPQGPDFWTLVACIVERPRDFTKPQKSLLRDAEIAFPGLGSSAEFRPVLEIVANTLFALAESQTDLGRPLPSIYCPVPTEKVTNLGDILKLEPIPTNRSAALDLYTRFREFLIGCPPKFRICPNCLKVFWARKSGQVNDSVCANRLRVREWSRRPENKQRIKETPCFGRYSSKSKAREDPTNGRPKPE